MTKTIKMRVAGHQAAAHLPGQEQIQVSLGALDQQEPATLSFTVPRNEALQYPIWATIEVSVKVIDEAKVAS